MMPWQPFLAFYIWGAHWRHLKNTTEPSMCGGDAALCPVFFFVDDDENENFRQRK